MLPTFVELSQKPYKAQIAWFVNGFWVDGIHEHLDDIWTIYKTFIEFDKRKDDGNELDEFDGHRLLEKFDETLTVKEMRKALRDIDLDTNKCISAIEYLTWKYQKTLQQVIESPQGDNTAAIEKAQAKVSEVVAAMTEVQEKLTESRQALKVATEAHDEAVAAEAKLSALLAELQKANDDLKQQQEAYDGSIERLTQQSSDLSLGAVKRNRSAAELEILKSEDPLPLRKAKITSDAALRKVAKQKVNAQIATAHAESTKTKSEEATAALEQAYSDLEVRMSEAEAELQEAKDTSGEAHGDFYIVERILFEVDSRLPTKKMKYDHSKPFAYSAMP